MKILYPGLRVKFESMFWEGRLHDAPMITEGIITAGPGEFEGENGGTFTWEVTLLDGKEIVASTEALEPILPEGLLNTRGEDNQLFVDCLKYDNASDSFIYTKQK